MKKILAILATILPMLSMSPKLSAQEAQTHPVLVANRFGNVSLVYHPLKNYVGKGQPMLLFFWASQYDDCREEAAFLQTLHQQYKGLTVLGVPIDGEIDATTAAMKELRLTFPQFFDMDDLLYDRYGVDGIPYTVLLNPRGEVIAENLHGDDLVKAVDECLR